MFRLPLKIGFANGPLGSGLKTSVFFGPGHCSLAFPECISSVLRGNRSQLCRRACTVFGSAPVCGVQDLFPALGWPLFRTHTWRFETPRDNTAPLVWVISLASSRGVHGTQVGARMWCPGFVSRPGLAAFLHTYLL